MAKSALFKLFVCMLITLPAFGQKVKYKDIWGLLSTRQYEAAEPFLKKYLRDNDDNPNAYLYMGIIFQEKSSKDDVLKQTRKAITNMDSAILFYDKAYKLITEKELRRNDEYYQIYNRRDLRTGEFGVKLSDVQYDIEKRMESLRERIDRVKMVKHYFVLTDSLYKKSNALFRTIQNSYPSQQAFYLRADEQEVSRLKSLAVRFDSCTKAYEQYRGSLVSLGRVGYNQNMMLNDINDFKQEGADLADFYQNDLQVWDYKRFAENARQIIEKEIFPMREHLIAYDIEINKLREKLNKDSVSVRSDLTNLIDKLLLDQLKKFDRDPLPMDVFSLKIADLEYRSALLENKPRRDSADVFFRLAATKKELKYVLHLDSVATHLEGMDITQRAQDYQHFVVNTYSNVQVLTSFIRAVKDYAGREKEKKALELLQREEALRWLIHGADSVPLVITPPSGGFKGKYYPLHITEEKYTVGLQYADTLNAQGYFFTITPARKPGIVINFPVDKPTFKLSRAPQSHAVAISDASGQIFFVIIYAERPGKDGKYAVSLAKIYRSDGLAWSNTYPLLFMPKELVFKPETGEVLVRADAFQSIIDKNGKLLK